METCQHLPIPELTAKQEAFCRDTHRYLGYGGARGGGKSFAVRADAAMRCLKFPGLRCLIVRRTYPELQANHIEPLCDLLRTGASRGADRLAAYHDGHKCISFPNGSSILFRYLDTDRDADRFQGTETDILYVDEATQQTEENMRRLFATVRGANRLPKLIRLTANPGGPGHEWFRRLFIDREYRPGERPEDYAFIQASVYDNRPLLRRDPAYLRELESLPPHLREMWLEGRWDVGEGRFFPDFRTAPDLIAAAAAGYGTDAEQLRREHRFCHVIEPFDLTEGERRGWHILRSYDFGYGRPFSCGWWAIDYEGVMYRILELYGCTDTPDEGVRWTTDQQFREIRRIEQEHPWLRGRQIEGVADPAIFHANGGESIAETAARCGVFFRPGDNARIPGWMQFHYRLQFDAQGYARCYVFRGCRAFIRTVPLLLCDARRPEDLDTDLEDHAADEARYAFMSRPLAPLRPAEPRTVFVDPLK